MKHFLVNSPDFFHVKNTKELQAESFIKTNIFNNRNKYQLNQLNSLWGKCIDKYSPSCSERDLWQPIPHEICTKEKS